MLVGMICPGCFGFVEILSLVGYFIDVGTRVPFEELVGQDFEILFWTIDAGGWERYEGGSESIGVEDFFDSGGLSGVKEIEEDVIDFPVFFKLLIGFCDAIELSVGILGEEIFKCLGEI